MPERSPRNAPTGARRVVDPRLVLGLVLVVASVSGVVGIVSLADDGIDVLAAPRLLVAGQQLEADDLEVRRVTLGLETQAYLTPDDFDDGVIVVTRTVGAGELVPLAAVGDERGVNSTTVVVTLTTPPGATVRPGDQLDLWSSPALDAGRFGPPVVIASGAQLVRQVSVDGIVAADDAGRVELLVPRRDIARILHALANRDALAVIPASVSLGR